MTKRKRGERNWEDDGNAYAVHSPSQREVLEQSVHFDVGEIFYVDGRPYIKAADGVSEPLDE